MIFRNSILSGTEFYYRHRLPHSSSLEVGIGPHVDHDVQVADFNETRLPHRSIMTNTLAWNSTMLEQPQHDNPKLILLGDGKHSNLDHGQKHISEWDGSLFGMRWIDCDKGDEQRPELRSRFVVQETRQPGTISV